MTSNFNNNQFDYWINFPESIQFTCFERTKCGKLKTNVFDEILYVCLFDCLFVCMFIKIQMLKYQFSSDESSLNYLSLSIPNSRIVVCRINLSCRHNGNVQEHKDSVKHISKMSQSYTGKIKTAALLIDIVYKILQNRIYFSWMLNVALPPLLFPSLLLSPHPHLSLSKKYNIKMQKKQQCLSHE